MILLFTDGSAIKNPGPAGWAWVAVRNGQCLAYHAGPIRNGTNNQGELQAAINALRFAADIHEQFPVNVLCWCLTAGTWLAGCRSATNGRRSPGSPMPACGQKHIRHFSLFGVPFL